MDTIQIYGAERILRSFHNNQKLANSTCKEHLCVLVNALGAHTGLYYVGRKKPIHFIAELFQLLDISILNYPCPMLHCGEYSVTLHLFNNVYHA